MDWGSPLMYEYKNVTTLFFQMWYILLKHKKISSWCLGIKKCHGSISLPLLSLLTSCFQHSFGSGSRSYDIRPKFNSTITILDSRYYPIFEVQKRLFCINSNLIRYTIRTTFGIQGLWRNSQCAQLWNEENLQSFLAVGTLPPSDVCLWLHRLSWRRCLRKGGHVSDDFRQWYRATLAHRLPTSLLLGGHRNSSSLSAWFHRQSM